MTPDQYRKPRMPLPSFLIIGAAKSGTTWLQKCLNDHSQFFVPQREIHFFTRHRTNFTSQAEANKWYESLFTHAKSDQIIGENSNSYLSTPGTAERIKALLPNAKIIALLRNPVDRAYSGYCMQYRNGHATANIKAYLNTNNPKLPQIICSGEYCDKLQEYYDYFDRNKIHIILYDDIRKQSQIVFRNTCLFLDVDEEVNHSNSQRINSRSRQQCSPFVLRLLHRTGLIHPIRNVTNNSKVFAKIRQVFDSQIRYPELPLQLRNDLAAYYENDILKTEALINKDLSGWIHDNNTHPNNF